MNRPSLTIATVNLNNASGLRATIQSVRKQKSKPSQFLVLDGGSTDSSNDLSASAADVVTQWISRKDNGIYDAMNSAIDLADSEYILFLNSGDTLHSADTLRLFFDLQPKADVVYGDVNICYRWSSEQKRYADTISDWFLYVDTVCHQTQFIRTDLFRKIGKYRTDIRIVADYEFLVRAFKTPGVSWQHLPVTVANYMYGGMSAKAENFSYIEAKRREIQTRYFDQQTLRAFKQCEPFYLELSNLKRSYALRLAKTLSALPGLRYLAMRLISTTKFMLRILHLK